MPFSKVTEFELDTVRPMTEAYDSVVADLTRSRKTRAEAQLVTLVVNSRKPGSSVPTSSPIKPAQV